MSKTLEDVKYLSNEILSEQKCEVAFYGLVRDINYKQGLRVILTNTSYSPEEQKVNALALVSPKLFSLPSAYLIKDDVEEESQARLVK